jgi:hypothetical protein
MTISLEAMGACLAGVSIIVFSRVLAFTALSFADLAASLFFAAAAFASHSRSGVNFY